VSPLANLAKLTDLVLIGTQVSDISALRQLTDLRFLALANTKVTDVSPLANLKKLTCLWLDDTYVDDLSALDGLDMLKKLRLDGVPVAAEEVARLQAALPSCQIVHSEEGRSRNASQPGPQRDAP
jgi:Leucine-rich repeat (LRR) protein